MTPRRGRVPIRSAGRRMTAIGESKAGRSESQAGGSEGKHGKAGGVTLITAPAPAPNLGGAKGP